MKIVLGEQRKRARSDIFECLNISSGDFCFNWVCEGKRLARIKLSKAILAQKSVVFERMFASGFREGTSEKAELNICTEELPHSAFVSLLQFFQVSPPKVLCVTSTAEFLLLMKFSVAYDIRFLNRLCRHLMEQLFLGKEGSLDLTLCCKILIDDLSQEFLLHLSVKYIGKLIQKHLKTQPDFVLKVLSHDELSLKELNLIHFIREYALTCDNSDSRSGSLSKNEFVKKALRCIRLKNADSDTISAALALARGCCPEIFLGLCQHLSEKVDVEYIYSLFSQNIKCLDPMEPSVEWEKKPRRGDNPLKVSRIEKSAIQEKSGNINALDISLSPKPLETGKRHRNRIVLCAPWHQSDVVMFEYHLSYKGREVCYSKTVKHESLFEQWVKAPKSCNFHYSIELVFCLESSMTFKLLVNDKPLSDEFITINTSESSLAGWAQDPEGIEGAVTNMSLSVKLVYKVGYLLSFHDFTGMPDIAEKGLSSQRYDTSLADFFYGRVKFPS